MSDCCNCGGSNGLKECVIKLSFGEAGNDTITGFLCEECRTRLDKVMKE